MREDWEVKTLDDLCSFSNGLWKGKKPPYINVGVIRNTNFTKEGFLDDSNIAYLDVEEKQFAKRSLKFGDIILEKSGGGPKQAVGRVVLFNKRSGDFSFSNFTAAIRVDDVSVLDARFLHKYLYWTYRSGVTEKMQSHSTGIRNLKLKEYKSLEIPFPPLAEQKRIVALLDQTFEGIELALAAATKNLKNARELFETTLNTTFTQKGEGWVETTLGEVCKTSQGVQIPKSQQYPDHRDGLARYFYISDFSHDKNVKYVADEHPNKLITPDDIIVVNTGASAGKIFRGQDGILSNNLFKVTVNASLMFPDLLFYFVNSRVFSDFQAEIVRGTANPHMGHKNFNLTPLALPNLSTQKSLISEIDRILSATQQLQIIYQQKIDALNELKQSLLQKAFAGELNAQAQPLEATG